MHVSITNASIYHSLITLPSAKVCVYGTMHGTHVTGEHRLKGKLCAKSSQYVFVVYDDGSYKMTGLSLEVAKGSGTPPTWDKAVKADPDSINVQDLETLCNMWDADGYSVDYVDGYDLKDVKVGGCGQFFLHKNAKILRNQGTLRFSLTLVIIHKFTIIDMRARRRV